MPQSSIGRLLTIMVMGLGLNACKVPTSSVEPYRGSITGYIAAYSGCDLILNQSGFRVRLRRSGMSMITDSSGKVQFDDVLALVPDTIDVAKEGYWPYFSEIKAYPEAVTTIALDGIFRIDPAQLEFVGDWWVRDTTLITIVDSMFVNQHGDLVSRWVYRELKDTAISITPLLKLNGMPAPDRYKAHVQYIHPGWQRGVSYQGPVFSLGVLRSHGVKSGDRLLFYGQAYDAECRNGYPMASLGLRDSVEFIMP